MVNTVTVLYSLVCLQFRDGSVGDSPAANGQLCELSSRAEIVKKECLILHVWSKGWDGWTSRGLDGSLSSASP